MVAAGIRSRRGRHGDVVDPCPSASSNPDGPGPSARSATGRRRAPAPCPERPACDGAPSGVCSIPKRSSRARASERLPRGDLHLVSRIAQGGRSPAASPARAGELVRSTQMRTVRRPARRAARRRPRWPAPGRRTGLMGRARLGPGRLVGGGQLDPRRPGLARAGWRCSGVPCSTAVPAHRARPTGRPPAVRWSRVDGPDRDARRARRPAWAGRAGHDVGDPRLRVGARGGATTRGPLRLAGKGHAEDRGLQLVEPGVAPDGLERHLVARPVEAQHAHAVGDRRVAVATAPPSPKAARFLDGKNEAWPPSRAPGARPLRRPPGPGPRPRAPAPPGPRSRRWGRRCRTGRRR